MDKRSRLLVGFFGGVAGLALVGCSGPAPEIELPDVRGTALDVATDSLEAAGFKNVEDEDQLQGRSIFVDSNWVVVHQAPAPGEQVPVDTEIQLAVAKIDDDGVADLLPAGSPVLVMLEEEAAKDQLQRQEQEAADVARAEKEAAEEAARAEEEAAAAAEELQVYVEQLDPPMRLGVQLITGIADFADEVRSGTLDDLSFQLAADTAMDASQVLVDRLELAGPPESAGRQAQYEQLQGAAEAIDRGADTLASARGTTRDSSLNRFDEIWATAIPDWNSALSALYDGTTVIPPQVG